MGAALRSLIEMALTFVVVWVLIFGGNGALLSRARGASPVIGFIWERCSDRWDGVRSGGEPGQATPPTPATGSTVHLPSHL